MGSMFANCYSLVSLNLSNINTFNVSCFSDMLSNCVSLKILNISNFDLSNAILIHRIFYNCSSLTSLDLGNFNISSAVSFVGLFYGCKEIRYLNLSKLKYSSAANMDGMFSNCNKLISVDLSNLNSNNSIYLTNLFKNCINLEYINLSRFIENSNANVSNIFDGVPDNIVYCINDEEKVPNIMNELNKKKFAINDCSYNWKSNRKKVIEENVIYVDECYYNNIYYYEYKYICYRNCPNGTKSINDKDYICVIDCPEELPFQKNEECIEYCNALDFFNEKCIINNKNIKAKEKIIKTIINEINTLKINEEKKDWIIKDKNITYQITSSNNHLKGEYNDLTTKDIGECENILKNKYNIKADENLIVLKIDYFLDGFLIPITEYKIFNPDNYEKIDLKECNETIIKINIPVLLNEEELYKYDPYY
jgi:surface protein